MSTAHHRLRVQVDDGAWFTTSRTEGDPAEVASTFRRMLADASQNEVVDLKTDAGHEVIRLRDIKRIAVDRDQVGDLLRALAERG